MLGTVPLPREGEEIPEFVAEINCLLKEVFDNVRQKMNEAHRKNKARHDEKNSGSHLTVGDRVWLYVPAVKQGRRRKLSSLWRGPCTVIDRVGAAIYRVQLMGSPKALVVHRNRLKLCYGEPRTQRPPVPTPQGNHSRLYPQPQSPHILMLLQLTQLHLVSTSSRETSRPQRNRQPPARYGSYVTH